jgi:uncharacterized protein YbjT (DUF2867 family)
VSRTALVAGASGLVGSHVLRLLLGDKAYERVTTFGRRELPLTNRKLAQRVIDFDRLAEVSDFPRVHDVFCCLGTTLRQAGSPAAFRQVDFTYVLELARVAARHRASQFLLVSALGADPHARVFYRRVKGEVEEAVKRVSFDAVYIFRPSLITGRRAAGRPAERIATLLSPLVSWAFVGPLRPFRPIRAETVARALVRAAASSARGVHVYQSDAIARLARR